MYHESGTMLSLGLQVCMPKMLTLGYLEPQGKDQLFIWTEAKQVHKVLPNLGPYYG